MSAGASGEPSGEALAPGRDAITRYDVLAAPPLGAPGVTAVLARLVDGLAFRYRWASDGLRREDLAFRPCEGAMDLRALLEHVRVLVGWVALNLRAARRDDDPVPFREAAARFPDAGDDPELLRRQTLEALGAASDDLLAMGETELLRVWLVGGREGTHYPVWNMINGPLADALTHVGQLASWRRIMGRPAPAADVFRGRPPRA